MCLKLQHGSSLEEIYSPSHSLAVIHGESIVSCYSCVTSWYSGSVRGERKDNLIDSFI